MALVCCKECGREVSDKAKFCPQCGYTFKTKGRGFAISGMVLGIIACTYSLPVIMATLSGLFFGFSEEFMPVEGGFSEVAVISAVVSIMAVLSLVFGILSASKGCKLKKTSAAISMGAISTVICLVCFVINTLSLL